MTKETENDSSSAAVAATAELYRSNLLRLQCRELVKESILSLHPSTAAALSQPNAEIETEVKWSNSVKEYLEQVKRVINGMGPMTLSTETTGVKRQAEGKEMKKYWTLFQSDKFLKSHSQDGDDLKKKSVSSSNGGDGGLEVLFPGGKTLQVEEVGCYGAGGMGLTTHRSNGNVLPEIDLAVLLPASSSADGENEVVMTGKDYLNHRYFDKRNLVAIHIAKYLSQKKNRKSIGSVHLSYECNDVRKVALILIPPTATPQSNDVDNDLDNKKRNKRRKVEDDNKQKKKKGKVRFVVRLVFGVQSQLGSATTSAKAQSQCWIPLPRLFPNRSNNRLLMPTSTVSTTTDPTPIYNNTLSEELHRLSTIKLVKQQELYSSFHETLTLLKIWCLQRGFLRGNDTFQTMDLTLLVLYLYQTKKIGKRMDCVQAFVIVLKFIVDTDWFGDAHISHSKDAAAAGGVGKDTIRHSKSEAYSSSSSEDDHYKLKKDVLIMPSSLTDQSSHRRFCHQAQLYESNYKENVTKENETDNAPKTLIECYKQYTPSTTPIFLDPTMSYNYFGRLSKSFMKELVQEAKKGLHCCVGDHDKGNESGGGPNSPFHQLFLQHGRFWRRYDAYVKVSLKDIAFPSRSNSAIWGKDTHDYGLYESLSRGMIHVLTRALGDRVHSIRMLTTGNGETDAANYNSNGDDSDRVHLLDSDQRITIPIRGGEVSNDEDDHNIATMTSSPVRLTSSLDNNNNDIIIIGLKIDPESCHRIVDRGPPADDALISESFLSLWGKDKAQLRRFKDGAIVHAVLWNDTNTSVGVEGADVVKLDGDEKLGGVVERIVRHIVNLHFTGGSDRQSSPTQFELGDILSLVESVSIPKESAPSSSVFTDSTKLHRNIMDAFTSLSNFLRQKSSSARNENGEEVRTNPLGLPLSIDNVEPLSPCLRYCEIFPPVPHPLLLGGGNVGRQDKISGVIASNPILIQIRFGLSSKWPVNDVEAMGAAKCAMLVQLANGIQKMKQKGGGGVDFSGPINVTSSYMDLGYKGYSWRILVRADQELKTLASLRNPSKQDVALYKTLSKRHVKSVKHHSTIHAVHTRHPSAGYAVRLAKRWLASHMISSDVLPSEAVELIIASLYSDGHGNEDNTKLSSSSPLGVPATPIAGFLRFLHLLSTYDFAREPLVVDPHGHIDASERSRIQTQFESTRGQDFDKGPAMYLISPNDRDNHDGDINDDNGEVTVGMNTGGLIAGRGRPSQMASVWAPTYTQIHPERVILSRAAALARQSYRHLMSCLSVGGDWKAVFRESTSSLRSYSALLRVDKSLILDPNCSCAGGDLSINQNKGKGGIEVPESPFTRGMRQRYLGPKSLRRKVYKNLSTSDEVLYDWQPVEHLVACLRQKFGSYAVFFYNNLAPDVIAMLWRPSTFVTQPFSAMNSNYKRPVMDEWQSDSLVVTNPDDIMREIHHLSRNVVVDILVLDDKSDKSNKNSTSSLKRKAA